MKTLKHLFDNNVAWSNDIKDKDPEFFSKLSKQQAPEYLWIGCSDSRVPANQIVSLPPGEVFVHRNIANVVAHTDLNCHSVIQYAVEILKVKHIIVCGHYGCGGIHAAMDDNNYGLIDHWLKQIKDVYRFNKDKLKNLSETDQQNLMCELNVIEQVTNVCESAVVQKAWRKGANLNVHGWIYGLENGILKDLEVTTASAEELSARL
ncbi:MAG: carbonate dehydratase [Sinobacterium sp.]